MRRRNSSTVVMEAAYLAETPVKARHSTSYHTAKDSNQHGPNILFVFKA
jgi:hypothetical protein